MAVFTPVRGASLRQGLCPRGWSVYTDEDGSEGHQSCYKEIELEKDSTWSDGDLTCMMAHSLATLMTVCTPSVVFLEASPHFFPSNYNKF